MNEQGKWDVSVLYVEDDSATREEVAPFLEQRVREVMTAENGRDGLALYRQKQPDLVITDIRMPAMDGLQMARAIRDISKGALVIVTTAHSDTSSLLDAIEIGIDQYVVKPLNMKKFSAAIEKCVEIIEYRRAHKRYLAEREKLVADLQQALAEAKLKDRVQAENIYLKQEIDREYNFGEIIGKSTALQYVFFRVEQVAPQDATVLLLGETGTGKGVVARAIQSRSGRKDQPMVTVNCSALPANLIESELFGREKGAFTGSSERQMGRFELADNGTLFLDEIGEMPLELQAKLLRVIQDGEFERLGGPGPSRSMCGSSRPPTGT